ncbi:hypothetical protein YC2023_016814 [Brassica napus]
MSVSSRKRVAVTRVVSFAGSEIEVPYVSHARRSRPSKKESIQNLNPLGLRKLLIHNNGKITITRKMKDGFHFSKPLLSLSL